MHKIHQIENKREQRQNGRGKAERSADGPVGLAASFSEQEVKNLFFSYLTAMLLVEGLIFFFSFINHLATEGSVFPWKPYLFATFITPVAITFVFGMILLTFNRFFFGKRMDRGDEFDTPFVSGGWGKGERITGFLQLIHRLPLLFSMFLLIAATALAYKLEDITIYLARAGATTAQYLFYTLIGVLVVGAVAVAIWVALSYRLKNKTLAADHQYRMQLMEQFGMVLMEDGTMIDKQGQVVYQHESPAALDYTADAETLPQIEEIKPEQSSDETTET